MWSWTGADGRYVINLFTQQGVEGRHGGTPGKATVSNVRHALKALRQFIEAEGITSVALPRLATGVGGLDWDEVQPLIQEHLGDLQIPVIVYTTYHQGQQADEKL